MWVVAGSAQFAAVSFAMPADENLKQPPLNRPIHLHNINCPYCGKVFDGDQHGTKEHVIGRRFVPRGTLDRQWNLILQACEPCNRLKADLEDDISAITMLPDVFGRYAADDPRLKAAAKRKAVNARSRLTGKPVGSSHAKLQLKGSIGPATLTFDAVAPPQIEDNRIFHLAHLHVSAFFYYLTYNTETRRGGYFLGEPRFLTYARRGDWGNPQIRWFMDLVRNWDHRILATGASGFFKLLIRKRPTGANVWSWAVEWNQCLRVFGFAGDAGAMEEIGRHVPPITVQPHAVGPNEWVAMRIEEELSAADDDLFVSRTSTAPVPTGNASSEQS